jgi:hypothetical protein
MIELLLLTGQDVLGRVLVNVLLTAAGAIGVLGFAILMRIPFRTFVATGAFGAVLAGAFVFLTLRAQPSDRLTQSFGDAMWFGGEHVFVSGTVVGVVTWLVALIGADVVMRPSRPQNPSQPLGLTDADRPGGRMRNG